MNLRNLFRRTSRKTRIAQLEAEVAQLAEWNLGWQDYAAELKGELQVAGIDLACERSAKKRYKAERDQYDTLARNLADELSAAQAEPAHIIADEHLTVLTEVTGKFPFLNCPVDPDFTGSWLAIDIDKPQKALPAGTRAA